MGQIRHSLKIIEKSEEEIDSLKSAVEALNLSDDEKETLIYGLYLIVWLPKLILEQAISMFRLKELLFGKSTRKSSSKKSNQKIDGGKANQNDGLEQPNESSANDELLEDPLEANDNTPPPESGRTGRIPHTDYDAVDHYIAHDDLKSGDLCPLSCGGKVYDFKPQVIIRINGQMHAAANRYTIDTKRCNLCGELFKPELPDSVGTEKYDTKFKAQLAVQKYYMGMPSYRQDKLQSFINIPVPHSTQWSLNEEVAGCAIPIFNLLCKLAANNPLLHIDDTHVKIIDEIIDNRQKPDKERKGMFTTGILAKSEDYQVILYFNGTNHAGENLDALLHHRTLETPVIIMSDALSRNIPNYKNIISCFCLSHGLRKFDELKTFYPVPCHKVIRFISDVYKIDRQTTDMTDSVRLNHHKKYSKPIIDELYSYCHYLIDNKLVESNDDLGKAVNYMLNHQHELTQFIRVKGVPLDNNVLEQCLKIPIRHRKNSMFYKNKYGACVGGILTSVIYTCMLSGINPIDYLTVLQENKIQVIKEPNAYLPWTYQDTLSQSLAA